MAPLQTEADALTAAYPKRKDDDVAAFIALCDPNVEWIEPADFPGGGVTRGSAALHALFVKHRANWAEGSCEPTRLIVAPEGRIVQLVHVHVRLKDEATFREGNLAEVYTFRAGKVIEVRIFGEPRDAFAWAGADESAV